MSPRTLAILRKTSEVSRGSGKNYAFFGVSSIHKIAKIELISNFLEVFCFNWF